MAFPQSQLDVRCEMLLGGTWTNITPFVYTRDGVTIGRGHADESTTTSPSMFSATVDNRDFRFTATNPTGPYYGLIGRNTPLRWSVPEGASYFRTETDTSSYASTPDSAGLSITGDTEIQIDVTLDNWNSSQILACKFAQTGNERSWILIINEAGTLTFDWSANGTAVNTATSTASVPLPLLLRQAIKVTLATATGTVTFWTAPASANQAPLGPITTGWVQLGAAVVVGANTVFDSTAPIQLGFGTDTGTGVPGINGKIHSFTLLSGIGGTAKASPNFTTATAGATSFSDAQSNTWTLNGTSEISNRKYRFHGELAASPKAADPKSRDVYSQISASGLLRRLTQGSQPLNSAMYRAYVRLAGPTAPVAYWPMEDLAGATQLASALGGAAMGVEGPVQLASNSDFACSDPIPALNGGTLAGAVPAYTGGQDNTFRFLMEVDSGGDFSGGVIARMFTTGTVRQVDLVYGTGGTLALNGFGPGGTSLFATGAQPFLVNGQLLRVSAELVASGSNLLFNITTLAPGATSGTTVSNTLTTASIGNVISVQFNPGGLLTATAIGHASVQPVWDSLFDLGGTELSNGTFTGPLAAWVGESAGNRFARLCGEEGIAFRGRGSLDDTVVMGTQTSEKLTDLLQECADADVGTMFEPRQVLGLGYRTRVAMCNQSAYTLSYPGKQVSSPLENTDDDQQTLNDITVTTQDGSSARAIQSSGTLSVQPPPAGVGRYDTSVTVNVPDSGASDAAGWRLHLGTVAEPRYPSIMTNLAHPAVTGIYHDLEDLDIGDRLKITGTPAWIPPDGIDQILQGVSETSYIRNYTQAWNGIPASPYSVGFSDDAVFGRADTDGSTLVSPVTSSATAFSVATTTSGSPLWTTTAGDFPFDIAIGGERVTVTNITGSSSPQSFTVTRSVNGVAKAQVAGADIRLFFPTIVSL